MLNDADRVELLNKAALSLDASYSDIELETYRRLSGRLIPLRPLIISAHDTIGRPERLNNILLEMADVPAAVNKIAYLARNLRDNLEIFDLLRSRLRPTIAICMGEAGLISRVLAPKFGATLTFASLETSQATAPGQPTIRDLKHLYRWDAIRPETKVYGVVAHPVHHSMSPAIHNAAFDRMQYDGVYLPLLVEPSYESFKAFLEMALASPGFDLSGLSITIPHKENALRYLLDKRADVEPLAVEIGAVNTIVISRRDGPEGPFTLAGLNTDYAAILDSITHAMGIPRPSLAGLKVAILGAGGTGRAAVAALSSYGCEVTIFNRTRARADELAQEFGAAKGKPVIAADWDSLGAAECDILINTTSVGMSPSIDQSPLDGHEKLLHRVRLVFDAVYNPMQTRLLTSAQAAQVTTVSGVDMFVRQAAAQFLAWTSLGAPVDVMRREVETRLAPPPSDSNAGAAGRNHA
jgi:3-dehydroquinate dehydratase/shikimate dehydrogenase